MVNRVMIVDDSKAARNMIRRSLEICGLDTAQIEEAGNGKEALDKLKSSDFDLVFTDLNMPEMGGEELLKRIKSSPKLNSIPVVVISSLANPNKENKLIQEHAAKILSKPLSLPDLEELLEKYLSIDI